MRLATGTVVGGYRIESVLGSGSMGTVYSALDVSLARRVAVKVLAPELSRDDRFRERFLRESKLAASLEHPNILPVYGAGEADGLLYIAMRYVDGRDLANLLKSLGRVDPERGLSIVDQIAGALDTAHARGLIHRDVKPANILLARHDGSAEHAYLCDFGLAKHASTVSSLTGDRAVVGTVDYLAPEQVEGAPVDSRVDVYALGCVLYECLTGEPPFRRDNELATVLAHVNDPPPRPSERRSDLPEAFDSVIATALARDRDARYATCAELVQAARAAIRGEIPLAPTPAKTTSAVRTFLFADVRGYTAYTREHGDEAGAELAGRFAEIVRSLAPLHEGHLQELRGDEALVVFDSARAALRFALELQRQVDEVQLPRPVGIGIDAGDAVPVEEGFRGGALNRAARLCSLARAGDVLASDAVKELAGAAEGVVYGFRRVERLKGYEKPVGVIEIHAAAAAPGRELGRTVRSHLVGTRPRRRILVAVAAVGLVAVAAGVLVVRGGDGGEAAGPAAPANSIAVIDTSSGKSVATVNPGSKLDVLVADTAAFWGMDLGAGFVQRIDVDTHQVVDQFPFTTGVYAVAPRVAGGSIWATAAHQPAVLRIDPRYRRVSATIELPVVDKESPADAQGLAVANGSVWAVYGAPKRIARIDIATNRVRFTREIPNTASWNEALVAAGGDMVWVIDRDNGRLVRVDPRSGDVVATGKLRGWVEDATVAGGSLWVATENDGGVWRVDRSGSLVAKIPTGKLPWATVAAGGAVWVPNANEGTVTRIDAETGTTTSFPTGHRPLAVGVSGDRLWAYLGLSADDARARVTGKNVVTQVTPGDPFFSTDPVAFGGDPLQLSLAYATGARLMEYRPAANGSAKIVPGVSTEPVVSGDGRTYTFTIRPGFRFSPPSGAPVTAEAFRYTIERALSPVFANAYCRTAFLTDVAGEDAYITGKASHISGLTVSGNKLVIELVEPDPALPARLTSFCLSVVPVGTPILADGVSEPIPSAGPYYIDSHIDGQQLVVKKNPNYGGDRVARIDALVVRAGVDFASAGRLVADGKADFVVDEQFPFDPAFAPGGSFERRFGAGAHPRYFLGSSGATRFLLFNTVRGPFRDVRLRRAASLALDRRALAHLDGGVPANLMVPPGMPGYALRAASSIPGPRIAEARALVGGRHPKVTILSFAQGPRNPDLLRLITRQLERVGFAVRVRLVVNPWDEARKPGVVADALMDGWAADYPDPSGFLNVLLDPKTSPEPPFFTDPTWLSRIRATARLRGEARIQAYTRLDQVLATGPLPYAVIYYARNFPQLYSPRIGCQVFLPQYGGVPDFASFCVKPS